MLTRLQVPGVYREVQPRASAAPFARTDVAGFVGLEPRVRDGTTPSAIAGGGHSFQVDVAAIQVDFGKAGKARLPARTDLVLSADASSIPLASGQTIVFSLAAARRSAGVADWVVARSPAGGPRPPAPPSDAQLASAAGGAPCLRIADVELRRDAGSGIFPVVRPRFPPDNQVVRCDDWGDFELAFGPLGDADDGTLLARSVWAFFANGGRRCWIAVVRRPRAGDAEGLAAAVADLVGVPGSSEREATGVERLLQVFDVAVLDVPDLYARRVSDDVIVQPLPPRDLDACFRRCDAVAGAGPAFATGADRPLDPLFSDAQVLAAQRALLVRCAPARWRVQLLLTAPVEFDAAVGAFAPPTAQRAIAWRTALAGAVDDLASACGAFYFPWLVAQPRVGGPVFELPPTGFAAGVIARRDLARGPHVSPASETLAGAVGLTRPIDDDTNAQLYGDPQHINVCRPFPGHGIQVWGARTLSGDDWMRFLAVRRCLSAIERQAYASLLPLVFEANTPALWFRVTQILLGILLPIFQSGALRGDTPEQAFFIRCDETTTTADQVQDGLVVCQVGVAIAAPAEFVVFRLSRGDAAVEVTE